MVCATITLLLLLPLISVWERNRDLTPEENVKCLDPRQGWFNQMPTWSGTPYFSPRCYTPNE
jgi:hypothetical protein